MPQLAEFYLGEKSKRMCQVVVGIDCDYRGGTKRTTLLVFRRHGSDSTGKKIVCHEQDIRRDDGAIIPGDPLRISMLDLAGSDDVPSSLRNKTIEIPVEKMHQFLELGEAFQDE